MQRFEGRISLAAGCFKLVILEVWWQVESLYWRAGIARIGTGMRGDKQLRLAVGEIGRAHV